MAALDALARRDHASEDLRRRLLDKGFETAVVADVVERLIQEHLIDDRRYVDNFVAYHAGRGQGPLRVRAELRKFSMQGALVEESLAAFPDWRAEAEKARRKKFGVKPPADFAAKQKQARFLGYRGFTSAQIRSALGFDISMDVDDQET